MKTSRFIWRIFLVPLVTMLCAFFVAPLQAQGQSVEAYVQMSADKTTLTFFYDTKRASREGTTWVINEKKLVDERLQYPTWVGTYENPNTTTTKAVFDASFKDFRPTSTAYWLVLFKALTNIEGLQNLNTSEVKRMAGMFDGCSTLTSLDLSNFKTEKVNDMNSMFEGCSALTSLDLSSFNTEKVTQMNKMFFGCSALTSLDLSNFNTSNVTEMNGMFYGCSALKSLDLSSFNTSNVTDMNGMFYGCSGLTNLDLKNFNTSEVTDMGWMFKGCSALTSLDLSSFNTSNVTDMSLMFSDCSSLKALALKNFNTENVTDMTGMFISCSGLTSLDLSNFTTSNVTKMSAMFSGCSGLTSLNLKNFNTEKVKSMDNVFAFCSALTSLDLKNFNTENVTDMAQMFVDCSALTSLNLKNFNTEKVEDMNNMFGNCSALKSLDLKNFNTSNVTNMRAMFSSCSGLRLLNLKNFNTSNVTDMRWMFSRCSKLANIVCDKTWKCEQSQEMFEGCTALKGAVPYDESKVDVTMANLETGYFTKKVQDKPEVTSPEAYVQMSADKTTLTFFYDTKRASREGTTWGIEEKQEVEKRLEFPAWAGTYNNPNKTTTKVVFDASFKDIHPTSTGFWFKNFKALTAIEGLQNLNTSEVTDMSVMFAGCSALTSLDLKNFNTSKVTNMSGMFEDCSALTSLDLSNFNTSNVALMTAMFEYCSALTSLDLKGFKTEKVQDMKYMFNNCSALTSLDLSHFNTEKVEDMSGMFAKCSKLASIVNNKTWNCEESQDMFKGCTALKGAVAYDESKTDVKMANPETGYFTKKVEDKPEVTTPEAYVQRSADKTTLTFFYDTKRATREGTTWGIEEKLEFEGDQFPAWLGTYENPDTTTTKAVVDASFANFRPTSTASWFQSFEALAAIEGLQNLNTSEVTNMRAMFNGCSRLTNLDLSSFNTSNVTDMGWMFNGCSALTSLDLKNFNTSNVTDMSLMFKDCSALKSLDLKNFNTSNVTDMSLMFNGCSGLKSLDLSNFNISKVTNMGGMFYGCSKLASIVCDKAWNSEYSYYMFKDCTALKGAVAYDESKTDVTMANPETGYFTKKVEDKPEVTTPEAYVQMSADKTTLTFFYDTKRASREGTTWGIEEKKEYNEYQYPAWAGTHNNPDTTTTKAVVDASFKDFQPTSTASWFEDFKTLTAIEGLQYLNTTEVTDMSGMFYGCSALASLNLSNFNTSNVTDMFGMFYGCSALTSLNLSSFNTSNVTNMGTMFENCSSLTSLNLSNFNTLNVMNMSGMFYGCSALTSLNLSSFNTSNVTNMGAMFENCSSLTSLNLSNFNTLNVMNMSGMFYGCSALTALDLKNFNTLNVKRMDIMFWGCKSLNSLDLSNFNTSEVTNMSDMFADCSSLTSIDLKSFNTEKVTNMGAIFYGCSALTTLDLKNFNTSNVTNMSDMFEGCKALTSLDLSNFNTSNVTNMGSMFYGCSALTSLNLSSFNTSNVTNMVAMFARCSALTSLDLKNFNTSNVTDMGAMFGDCSTLTTLDISSFNTSNVEGMSKMFWSCSALKSLDFSSFNTEKVKDMRWMFAHCSKLASIVNNKVWNCEQSQEMFKGCTALKGAVAYDASKIDATMANPETGYFTKKAQDKPEVTTPEAYVQMSADKTTLTFFYDTKRTSREGTTWDITSPIATRSASLLNAPAWGASEEKPNSTTTKVVFDASFAKFYPKTTAEWFAHYAALKRIEGIENLNTSEVTSMKGMFTGCAALDTLDLTTFNTDKVNDMSEMFKNCANLSTVVCDKVWSTPHSEQMFYGCVKLLGKAAFDANKTSVEMANPNSGYFVATKPTALLSVFSLARANGIYTLQGKRVRGNLQHLPAGVYIVNGKKVMVQ